MIWIVLKEQREGEGEEQATYFYWKSNVKPYLIFVIFFTRAKFLENKIYTKKRQFFALNL